MSEPAKKRGPNNTGYKHTALTKKHYSNIRKGKPNPNKKIDNDTLDYVIECYKNNSLELDKDLNLLTRLVKKTQKDKVSTLNSQDLISPNGKKLTLETIYAKYFSERFGCSAVLIRKYLIGETIRCK